MGHLIILALVLPLFTGVCTMSQSGQKAIRFINLLGSLVLSGILLTLVQQVANSGTIHVGQFYID